MPPVYAVLGVSWNRQPCPGRLTDRQTDIHLTAVGDRDTRNTPRWITEMV